MYEIWKVLRIYRTIRGTTESKDLYYWITSQFIHSGSMVVANVHILLVGMKIGSTLAKYLAVII
jgi:hypothetical protein